MDYLHNFLRYMLELCDTTPSLRIMITLFLVIRYTLGIDTLHDMAYMT